MDNTVYKKLPPFAEYYLFDFLMFYIQFAYLILFS